MTWPRITPFYRTLIAIALALALPTLLVVTLQIYTALQRQKTDIEGSALLRAEQISALNDAQVQTDLTAMRILAGSVSLNDRDWTNFLVRTQQALAVTPSWKTIIISDLNTGQELFDHSRPQASEPRPLSPAVTDPAYFRGNGAGGVARQGEHCPCVYMHFVTPENLVMTVVVDPAVFEELLAPRTPAGATSATVDRQGNFIARNLAFEDRVGTPGAPPLRNAVAKGGEGVYEGVTLEGVKNYTAYVTSPVTGWSTHIAVRAALIDNPGVRSNLTLLLGAAAAILVAATGIAFALYNLNVRRKEEERLREAQKLEALGRLTGGVAHDFNNLLTVVIGSLGMLLPKLDDPRSRRWAESAMEAAQRGSKLTRQLLAFSRGQELQIGPVSMVALLDGMHDLLRQSIGPDVSLEYDIDPEHYWVRSDENQLELAILNLAINARDAMPDGGTLTVTVRPSTRDDKILIEVTDTGVGMPREVAERAMEPFFTTKPMGSGTGLGLAQVFGAIQQSGGSVKIDSVEGAGTTVCLTLPVATPPAEPDREAEPLAAATLVADRPRILVVEDEAGVRDILAETLRNAGYLVSEAPDGPTALPLIEAESFALLVTDFAMPGMNGAELARQARAISPDLRVLIVSGHADIEAVEQVHADAPLLRKPFQSSELLTAVQTALL